MPVVSPPDTLIYLVYRILSTCLQIELSSILQTCMQAMFHGTYCTNYAEGRNFSLDCMLGNVPATWSLFNFEFASSNGVEY